MIERNCTWEILCKKPHLMSFIHTCTWFRWLITVVGCDFGGSWDRMSISYMEGGCEQVRARGRTMITSLRDSPSESHLTVLMSLCRPLPQWIGLTYVTSRILQEIQYVTSTKYEMMLLIYAAKFEDNLLCGEGNQGVAILKLLFGILILNRFLRNRRLRKNLWLSHFSCPKD